jgi:hypothetical protein
MRRWRAWPYGGERETQGAALRQAQGLPRALLRCPFRARNGIPPGRDARVSGPLREPGWFPSAACRRRPAFARLWRARGGSRSLNGSRQNLVRHPRLLDPCELELQDLEKAETLPDPFPACSRRDQRRGACLPLISSISHLVNPSVECGSDSGPTGRPRPQPWGKVFR